MAAPPSIIAVKQAFLDRETRQLTQPLTPSRAWSRAHDSRTRRRRTASASAAAAGDDGPRPLPDKAVDDALARVNQLLQQHARRVYAPQAVRHVAEQLDQLYWQAGERAMRDGESGAAASGATASGSTAASATNLGVDLTHPDTLAALPPAWDDPAAVDALPLEARRYEDLLAQARALADRRAAAAARVQRLRQLAGLLAPFGTEVDGSDTPTTTTTTQDNLVTRDGPVERELERMRLLLARVGDRVAALPPRAESPAADVGGGSGGAAAATHVDGVEATGQKRVQALLEQF